MRNTIIYMPHCSECGGLISGDVSRKIVEIGNGKTSMTTQSQHISPSICPNCGASLEVIIIPQPTGDEFTINMDEFMEKIKERKTVMCFNEEQADVVNTMLQSGRDMENERNESFS